MNLKTLLQRIALQKKEEFPFPDDIESYLEDFVPNALLKSASLQHAFGITNEEMEKLYEEAFSYYEADRYLDALTVFRWLVLFNAFKAKYWLGFAACQQLMQRYEKALHAYAMASLLAPESPDPHYHAYECYMEMEDKDEAQKALKLAEQKRGHYV
ncbi:MAG: Chaperone protein SicA [Chlamydiales bacterium]|nr:Chaperone protein SicA [Chlamydiales bacterium]